MPNSSWILKDLIVVTALVRLVSKEMYGRVVDSPRQILLVLDVLKAVSLVPALGKDIEGDLAADRVAKGHVSW